VVEVRSHDGERPLSLHVGSEGRSGTGHGLPNRRELLARCDVASVAATGYGFQIELEHRALAAAGGATEVPIVFADRVDGVTKIPRSTVSTNLLRVPSLRVSGRGRGLSARP
jgi:dolichol-phosphate mannosyltransferase